ncbi:MAG: flagellar hook assembly protein FlgD [Rhodospirillaceae bacterium]|nr:flagellar hook assembly protein FlgD [Rhodospirillaceae bacterium]
MILDSTSGISGVSADSKSLVNKEKLDADLNRFLTLLVTQLKNQDPLEPMDANQFTQQLVQFASVEQQIYQNANLEKLVALQNINQVGTLVNYIGTTVEVTGADLLLENATAKFSYTLDETAKSNTISIMNDAGDVVYTMDGQLTADRHEFVWDGMGKNGVQQPDGAYSVVVSATDAKGNPMEVSQTSFGRVAGAGADEGQVELYLGQIPVALERVLNIKETPPPI